MSSHNQDHFNSRVYQQPLSFRGALKTFNHDETVSYVSALSKSPNVPNEDKKQLGSYAARLSENRKELFNISNELFVNGDLFLKLSELREDEAVYDYVNKNIKTFNSPAFHNFIRQRLSILDQFENYIKSNSSSKLVKSLSNDIQLENLLPVNVKKYVTQQKKACENILRATSSDFTANLFEETKKNCLRDFDAIDLIKFPKLLEKRSLSQFVINALRTLPASNEVRAKISILKDDLTKVSFENPYKKEAIRSSFKDANLSYSRLDLERIIRLINRLRDYFKHLENEKFEKAEAIKLESIVRELASLNKPPLLDGLYQNLLFFSELTHTQHLSVRDCFSELQQLNTKDGANLARREVLQAALSSRIDKMQLASDSIEAKLNLLRKLPNLEPAHMTQLAILEKRQEQLKTQLEKNELSDLNLMEQNQFYGYKDRLDGLKRPSNNEKNNVQLVSDNRGSLGSSKIIDGFSKTLNELTNFTKEKPGLFRSFTDNQMALLRNNVLLLNLKRLQISIDSSGAKQDVKKVLSARIESLHSWVKVSYLKRKPQKELLNFIREKKHDEILNGTSTATIADKRQRLFDSEKFLPQVEHYLNSLPNNIDELPSNCHKQYLKQQKKLQSMRRELLQLKDQMEINIRRLQADPEVNVIYNRNAANQDASSPKTGAEFEMAPKKGNTKSSNFFNDAVENNNNTNDADREVDLSVLQPAFKL